MWIIDGNSEAISIVIEVVESKHSGLHFSTVVVPQVIFDFLCFLLLLYEHLVEFFLAPADFVDYLSDFFVCCELRCQSFRVVFLCCQSLREMSDLTSAIVDLVDHINWRRLVNTCHLLLEGMLFDYQLCVLLLQLFQVLSFLAYLRLVPQFQSVNG